MTEDREGFRPTRELPRNTEGELPESKIFDLLSSVGNGENKALELIVMRPGVIYSGHYLHKEVMDHQAEDRKWRINKSVPFAHCQHSLSPIGLVTREAISPDGSTWGYQITKYGLETGLPFAGVLLKWSHEHPNFSLYKMFSATQSSSIKDEQSLDKKRAQEVRYKILWEIVTNPTNRIRNIDIAGAIDKESNLVSMHLKNLNENGILSYEVTSRGKALSYFRKKEFVPAQRPEQFQYQKTLSFRVYDLITSQYQSAEEIVNALIQNYPEYESLDRKSFLGNVTRMITHFEKQGYVERQKFGYGFRSEITLSDEQREVIASLMTAIDKFKNGDRETIEEGRRFAQRVVSDPSLFSKLILKAKEASPIASGTSREDRESWLISILREHPNSTMKEIRQYLEKDYGKRLREGTINYYLRALSRDKKITSEKTKFGNVHRAVEEENQAS